MIIIPENVLSILVNCCEKVRGSNARLQFAHQDCGPQALSLLRHAYLAMRHNRTPALLRTRSRVLAHPRTPRANVLLLLPVASGRR